jgi:hypothetical protein
MSRRVSKTAIALLALTLVLQVPSAFALSRDRAVDPDFGITRIVTFFKKIVRTLVPTKNDDPIDTAQPPKP